MVWLIILAVLLLLAILPIGVSLRYNSDGFRLRLLLGWIPLSLKKRQKKDPKEKKEEKAQKTAKKISRDSEKKKEKGGSWKDFLPLIRVAMDFLDAFRRKMKIRRLNLKFIMAADDPCDLAINYGKAWTAVGSLMPQLERVFIIRKRKVEVECDFEASESRIWAKVDLVICLGPVIYLLLRYGLQAINMYLKQRKLRKGGASNE